MGNKERFDLYKVITDTILEGLKAALETGKKVPWRKKWSTSMPQAVASRGKTRDYRGINIMLLWQHPFSSNLWITFKKCKELGGNIRKGEKSRMVVFWKYNKKTRKNEAGEEESYTQPIFRYYRVFNVEQCDNLKLDIERPNLEEDQGTTFDAAKKVVREYLDRNGPKFEHGSDGAYYVPAIDTVSMPHLSTFEDEASYYSVAFHELAHSTGVASRLDRFGLKHDHVFGTPDYSAEELIAEISSAFLGGITGIENDLPNTTAYIRGWIRRLEDDPKMVVFAAQRAQKAVDYILGFEQVKNDS